MFGLFTKKIKEITAPSCKSCRYYNFYKTVDKLNPDKTITKGKVEYEWCDKGKFYLKDYNACEMYKEMVEGDKRSARIMPPPFRPPLSGATKCHSGPCVSTDDDIGENCIKCNQ